MPPLTSASSHYELLAADGVTWLPLMVRRPQQQNQDDPAYPTVQELLTSAEQDAPTSEKLAVSVQETWIGGIGVPDIGYNVAPGVYCRTDGVAMAAGAMTVVQVPNTSPTYNVNSPIVAFAEFNGDLFVAQEGRAATYGGRVIRSIGGSAAFIAVAFSHADYVAHPAYLNAGEYMRDLWVSDNGSAGTMYLYASSSDINGLNGRLHRTTDGANWASTNATEFDLTLDAVNRYGRGRTKAVHWTTSDGSSGHRLETISGKRMVSYTIPDGDPFLNASWVEGVPIKSAYPLLDTAAARTHVWHSTIDGLYDLNERGESPNLMSRGAMMAHSANGLAVEYLDGWVYQTVGDGGIHRVWVDDGPQLQEYSGVCGPGRFTEARSDWLAGYATAMISLDGWIVPAFYNPLTQKSAIFFGIDREKLGVQTRNPLVWHGPEFTLNADYKITRIWASTLAGDRRLWIAGQSVIGLQAILRWGSLPESGAPLDALLSDSLHRYNTEAGSGISNPYCRIEHLPQTFGDKNSLHVVNDVAVGSEGLEGTVGGTRFTVYQRADPTPGSTAWGTGRDIIDSPTQTLTPTTTLEGHVIQTRIDFLNPSGGATPALVGVLDAVRITRFDNVPNADIKVIPAEWGTGVTLLDRTDWEHLGVHPDTVTTAIRELAGSGRTTMRDPWDNRRTVKVHNPGTIENTVVDYGDYQKHVQAELRLTDLGPAA